ncbi:MAG: DUF2147 domain-containing protein [Rhodobacteraceae bacterium]|nr:DUF2147 domain-containing protein [Paracoccaceae bacterium]
MKKLIIAAAVALITTPALAGDPVLGMWRSAPDDNGNTGHISVTSCGAKICGKLVKSFDKKGKETPSANIGRNIIWNMVSRGDGYYDSGKIWSPDRDKTYKSNMQLTGNKLKVKGCIAFICRDGGTWKRVN